jgi:hypothetical protein
MSGSNARRFALALLASSALAAPALAQSVTAPAPLHDTVDANHVDLIDGHFRYSVQEAVIGSGPGAVSLERFWGDGGFRDNWSGGLYLGTDGNYYIDFGGISDSFSYSGTSFTSRTGNGATLTGGGASGYTYTAADGTTIFFQSSSEGANYPLQGYSCPNSTVTGACAIPTLMTRPDGMKFTINFDIAEGLKAQTGFFRFRGREQLGRLWLHYQLCHRQPRQSSQSRCAADQLVREDRCDLL